MKLIMKLTPLLLAVVLLVARGPAANPTAPSAAPTAAVEASPDVCTDDGSVGDAGPTNPRHLTTNQPTHYTICGKSDGFGAQYQAIMSGIAYCAAEGLTSLVIDDVDIAIHIRRGDVSSGNRYTTNEAYKQIITKLQQSYPGHPIKIFSEGHSDDFQELSAKLCLNMDIQTTFHSLVTAKVLVTAKSRHNLRVYRPTTTSTAAATTFDARSCSSPRRDR